MTNVDRNKIRATVLEQAKQDGAHYIIDLVISVYEAALAEIESSSTGISNNAIEKCEPVKGVVIREGLPTLLSDKYIKATDIKLFTSPQPIELVSLNYPEILECLPEGAKRVPEGWLEFYQAIEAKLKHLNTKG